ncbi:MAG: extracellular solute-binding protein, partial [Bacteroidetes bacterium]|nr:extracellular solute-binding protein [Bacteroidota bacterium]
MKKLSYLILLLLLSACGISTEPTPLSDADAMSWEAQLVSARGKEITLMMWPGDPLINAYMKSYVKPEVKQRFDINLNIVPGQGNQIVSSLMTEMEAGKTSSEVDMVWINGETFYQLRQIKALHGPFAKSLPNAEFINWESAFIGTDFQQPVDGFECPWGNVQMTLIYDSLKVSAPPMTLDELGIWVKANPGKFTLGNNFTGMTLLKAWLIDFAGGGKSLNGDFDEAKYLEASTKLWDFINA